MAALNENFFTEWQPTELDLFGLSPTQTALERIFYQQVRPISQLTPFSAIEFIVVGNNGLQYVDLKNSYISLKIRIVHGATGKVGRKTDLKGTEYVGPVNLIVHSLFEQVDVTLHGKLVSAATTHYPYKAYLQKLLNFGVESKVSQMSTWKFIQDHRTTRPPPCGGWSGGAMVLGKLAVPGRPTIWITVGQGPTALAVGAGGVVWTFLHSSILSLLFLPLFGRQPDID